MAFAEKVTVFAETNLGTRIVVTVSLDITAGDFKRELEKEHVSCFSRIGEMRVQRLMVKRKSRFYYLAESVPLKYMFRKKPWFIHVEARVVNGSQEPRSISNSMKGVTLASSSLSIASAAEMKNSECFIPKTPKRKPADSDNICEIICKKLTAAAHNIRTQGKTQTHLSSSVLSSILRSNTCRYDSKTVTSVSKFLVFEVPDYED